MIVDTPRYSASQSKFKSEGFAKENFYENIFFYSLLCVCHVRFLGRFVFTHLA